jgi:tetratricopeptide (TPR) repeat protein
MTTLILAALLAVIPAAAPLQDVELGREWVDAVRAHRPGATDEPAARVAAWSQRELERAFKHFTDLDDTESNAIAVRAAMLHADIAMWQWDAQQGLVRSPPSPGEGTGRPVMIVIDGRYAGDANVTVHWSFARRLIDRIRPSPAGHELARVWYRGTLAYLLGSNSFTEGLPHIARARRLFPNDAFFALASGCASETLGSFRIQETVRSMARDKTTRVEVSSAATHLRDAEQAFRAALALEPSLVEARLRLGRVLALRRDNPGAVLQLEAVLEATRDPALRYYAYLFLGERRESLLQFVEAREAYEEAARVSPTAQSPLVALSHLARRSGDRAAARRAAARLAQLPAHLGDRYDPWWYYDLGPGRDAERYLSELRAALAAPSR